MKIGDMVYLAGSDDICMVVRIDAKLQRVTVKLENGSLLEAAGKLFRLVPRLTGASSCFIH